MTGPALANVEQRWNENRENLRSWIRNAPVYLATRSDEYTNNLSMKYDGVMTAFPNLKDEEIDATLEYINYVAN